MKNRKKLQQWILALCLVPILAGTGWCGWQVYQNSTERAFIKDDYSEANSIIYGLLSVDSWQDEVESIIIRQIDEFELSPGQDSILQVQISSLLNAMLDEAKSRVQQDDETFGRRLRKWAVNAMVDWDGLRQQVPAFTRIIIKDLTKPESKERLKLLAREKISEYAAKTFDDSDSLMLNQIYQKYDTQNLKDFNAFVLSHTAGLQKVTYHYTYIILGVVLFFLCLWFLAAKIPNLRKPLFIFSVILAVIVLLTGLTSPMIEIDARIKEVNFTLLGSQIEFYDQILFYRSKSILQVVGLLLESPRIDSILVGSLVLAFSVLLPASKLISTGIYLLFNSTAVRSNMLLKWMAFKSGKWSMADVMVVAIFMAYVSFDGILDAQLKQVEVDTQQLTSISTNLTSLEPGFILFLTYVLFGLILATILKSITNTTVKITTDND